jgi:hypothetical protein
MSMLKEKNMSMENSIDLTEVEQLKIVTKLDEAYQKWCKVCLKNPDLDIFDISDAEFKFPPATKQPNAEKREAIAFNILLSIFEDAYLALYDNSKMRTYWILWENTIKAYAERSNFKNFYKNQLQVIQGMKFRPQFDPDFENYMNRLI